MKIPVFSILAVVALLCWGAGFFIFNLGYELHGILILAATLFIYGLIQRGEQKNKI